MDPKKLQCKGVTKSSDIGRIPGDMEFWPNLYYIPLLKKSVTSYLSYVAVGDRIVILALSRFNIHTGRGESVILALSF